MSIEGIYRKRLEPTDTDKLKEFENQTNNQLFDLLAQKKEEEIKKYEEEVKTNAEESQKKRQEEIAELKHQKEELLKVSNRLRAASFESEIEEKGPTTHAEKAIAQSEAELAEFLALAAEEEEAMMRSPRIR